VVAEQGIGDVLALGELGLLLRRLRADADERGAVRGEVALGVAKGAALRRAPAGTRDVSQPSSSGWPGTPVRG